MEPSPDRMAAMWRDYERYGGPADPAKGQSADRRWSLAFCLVCHFGRFPWLFLQTAEDTRLAGGLGWDPCLPEPGTAEYEVVDHFVRKAEQVIEETTEGGTKPLHEKLGGYKAGRRVLPAGLNLHWAIPLNVIERSGALRDGLISKLKKTTLASPG